MKRCIGQRGKCLLCYYDLSLRPPSQARSYASFYKSTVRTKRPRNSVHREEREEKWIERQLTRPEGRVETRRSVPSKRQFKSTRNPVFYQVERRITLPEDEDEAGQLNIPKRLDRCLDQVWHTEAAHGAADTRLLKDLDPTGDRWPKFVDSIRQLFGMPGPELDGKQKQIYADLTRHLTSVTSESYAGATVRFLRFSFIDEALKAQGFSFHQIIEYIPDMQNPTEWYPQARSLQRQVHLHVGPTNSGKTYNALKQLEGARSGYYAGPLRLLAHEVYSRFLAKGIPCDLVTGDDVRLHEDIETRRTSSTVEMVSVTNSCDVAVIDEIQMIADKDRGWAWTRALLGTQAREVHLCGEERVIPLIQELAATMGDNLKIHRYERLNPLKVMSRSLRGDLKNLRKGDCVVSFSVMSIHAMKKQIEKETGRHAAIVYGSLPPETRAQQAALFNNPDNDYDFLVASDAIGMGLNLSIKRIIFESLNKFNGVTRERISISQIKQIAGRAGRYRTSRQDTDQTPKLDIKVPSLRDKDQKTVGLVTCLDENDLPIIRDALSTDAHPIKAAGILPPGQYIEEFSNRLPPGLPFEYLYERVCKAATVHPRYMVCDTRSQIETARAIESVQGLSIADRVTICGSPAETRKKEGEVVLQGLARCIAEGTEVTIADMPEVPLEILDQPPNFDRTYLVGLEVLHKSIILYLWLGYRFSSIFRDMDMAFHAKELTEEKINLCLTKFSANPKLRQRLEKMKEYSVPLEPTNGGSASAGADTVPTADDDGEFIDETREKASSEDESAELELAVAELEQVVIESEAAPRESGGPNLNERELNGSLSVDPEHRIEHVLSSEEDTSNNSLDRSSEAEDNLGATPSKKGESGIVATANPSSGTDASANQETSNDDSTAKQHDSNFDWTSGTKTRPVFIPPTGDQSRHEDEAADTSR